jgi:hypothetical protein
MLFNLVRCIKETTKGTMSKISCAYLHFAASASENLRGLAGA